MFDDNGILEQYDKQEQELLIKLQEVKRLKAEKKAEMEAAERLRALQNISVLVIGLNDAKTYFGVKISKYHQDMIDAFRSIKSRWYNYNNETNFFALDQYNDWLKLMADKFPQVTINYKDDAKQDIENIIDQPTWTIKLDTRNFKLVAGRGHTYNDIYNIPGIDKVYGESYNILYYKAPLAEGWRILQNFERLERDYNKKIVWEQDALEFVLKQIEKRKAIDEIAIAKDWNWDVEFFDKTMKLRPVQRVAGAFIEAVGEKALLAYQMGLGKTVISVGYALKNDFKSTLVICPASLKANWCRQIYKMTGIKPHVLMGTKPADYDLIQLMTNPPKFVVTNYDTLSVPIEYVKEWKDEDGKTHKEDVKLYPWIAVINSYQPDLVIVDESHYIKNTDSNRSQAIRGIKAKRLIHMTGTPVLNRPGELWPMLNMISPETFPSEETFIKQYSPDRKTARNVNELKEILKAIMIRRKQSDVVDELPPLNRIEEYHELSNKAVKLYNKVLEGIYERMREFEVKRSQGEDVEEESVASVLAKIMRLKQICAIDKVNRTADMATEIYESSENGHNKVLIFSQFKAVAYAIHQRLGHESLCFVQKGRDDFKTVDMNERDALVQQFQNDPKIKYLVVTEKTAREGHDITAAGHVIFNDLFWTPANHDQAEGRAYMRISDPHGIDSYYLITDMGGDGIEEWIWDLLGLKTSVINSVVEGVESSRDVSVAAALIQKLKDSMWTPKHRK